MSVSVGSVDFLQIKIELNFSHKYDLNKWQPRPEFRIGIIIARKIRASQENAVNVIWFPFVGYEAAVDDNSLNANALVKSISHVSDSICTRRSSGSRPNRSTISGKIAWWSPGGR